MVDGDFFTTYPGFDLHGLNRLTEQQYDALLRRIPHQQSRNPMTHIARKL